jgi:hypothetical protein
VSDSSQIIANAFEGQGGNIRLNAEVFLADPASVVRASSEQGIQGTVEIRAPVTQFSEALAPLPQVFVNIAALLPARCATRAQGGRYSTLFLGGREGLPLDPGDLLPSLLTLDERLMEDPAMTGEPHRQKVHAKLALLAGKDKVLSRLRWLPAVLS